MKLKYRTLEKKFTVKGELFSLKNQGDPSWSRYDFLKDVQRIERYKEENSQCDEGYAILLTNDHRFEEDPKKSPSLKLTGTIGGEYSRDYVSEKQKTGRIILNKTYVPIWGDYYSDTAFRYLIVKV